MYWIKPLMVALSVYCIPVWVLTEALATLLLQLNVKARPWAQLVLRGVPVVIAFVLAELSPRVLIAIINGFGVAVPAEITHGELGLFAVVVGAGAVQLHQWRIPQIIQVYVTGQFKRLGTDPGAKTRKDPPS